MTLGKSHLLWKSYLLELSTFTMSYHSECIECCQHTPVHYTGDDMEIRHKRTIRRCAEHNFVIYNVGVHDTIPAKFILQIKINDMRYNPNSIIKLTGASHIDGILPKGPYPPCLRMADRALLAGYPRYMNTVSVPFYNNVVFNGRYIKSTLTQFDSFSSYEIWVLLEAI